MSSFHASRLGRRLGAAVVLPVLFLATAAPSWAAAEGNIDFVEPKGSAIQVLYSISELPGGVSPALASLEVTVDGTPVQASAELAADADADRTVRRTTIMAIDVSRSMTGERFTQAKLAAEAFLAGVSPDVYVGIVAFAGDVTTVQEPSLDRAESVRKLDELSLTLQTRLYDGLLHAVDAAGEEGQRSVLVLSDGADTSNTALDDVTAAIEESGVKVDVVALAQGPRAVAALESIASAGEGTVLPAGEAAALTQLFSAQAAELAQQVLITAELPAEMSSSEGTVGVSLQAGDEVYTDTAFVPLTDGSTGSGTASEPQPVTATGFNISKNMMFGGLAAAGVGVLVLLLSAFGVFGSGKPATLEDRIAAYSRNDKSRRGPAGSHSGNSSASHTLTGSAVGMTERALSNNAGVAAKIGARLEAAGLSLKPAEWVLLHAGIALCAGLVGLLLSSGSAAALLLFLLGGAAIPWVYLGHKRSKRVKAFNEQLADTLQLISGGLSAGLSLAQSVDTVVRQGSEPMSTEFKRALLEARLGVSIEDALESIADRMQSKDFRWVVIAVRIQREVGGNLSEVLAQVATTMRERAYLKRQVKSLSAEGKMSAWVLGALPVAIFAFLMATNGAYFEPMLTSVLGWLLLGLAATMMAMGAFWMSRLIKMEV